MIATKMIPSRLYISKGDYGYVYFHLWQIILTMAMMDASVVSLAGSSGCVWGMIAASLPSLLLMN